MNILITGGCGYIGSHCAVVAIKAGWHPIILDDLSNSGEFVIERIHEITGVRPTFIRGDVRDATTLKEVFSSWEIDAVLHFAAHKAVGESVEVPLSYYHNNVGGTLTVLEAMKEYGVKTFVFSSSATVYGEPKEVPIQEHSPRNPTSPYARTKVIIEDILADLTEAEPDWRIARLRYFNPVGAHESGLIGEDPRDTPNNLMPYIAQVAVGQQERLSVFGGDYPTRDGTCLRDYIHVMDLAEGHLAALDHLRGNEGLLTVNLGTGTNSSVLEVIGAFQKASGQDIPYEIVGRRPGDVSAYWADASLAKQLLGWRAKRNLAAMCADTWRWQAANPSGFRKPTEARQHRLGLDSHSQT